jgi:hypothetical protein
VTTVGILVAVAEIAARMSWFADWGDDDNNGSAIMLIGIAALAGALAFGARILSLAISRHREELADVSAAELVSPSGIRKALEKLEADHTVVHHVSRATAHLWLVTPLRDQGDDRHAKLNKMFDSHPPLDERIAILRRLEGLDPDGRGPVDETITGVPVDLNDIAQSADRRTSFSAGDSAAGSVAMASASAPATAAPTSADDAAPALVPVAGKSPPGWYRTDATTLHYWNGTAFTDWTASWNGARWIQSHGSR